MNQPILQTDRLTLEAYTKNEASQVMKLAGDVRVAETTLNVPHPYTKQMGPNLIALTQL